MAVAFEEEMHALKLVPDPSGKPRFVDEPYLQVNMTQPLRLVHDAMCRLQAMSIYPE